MWTYWPRIALRFQLIKIISKDNAWQYYHLNNPSEFFIFVNVVMNMFLFERGIWMVSLWTLFEWIAKHPRNLNAFPHTLQIKGRSLGWTLPSWFSRSARVLEGMVFTYPWISSTWRFKFSSVLNVDKHSRQEYGIAFFLTRRFLIFRKGERSTSLISNSFSSTLTCPCHVVGVTLTYR